MTRPAQVVSMAFGLAVGSVAVGGVSHAGPPPPCSFTLSSPQVVQSSGATMVTAVAELAGCGPGAGPYSTVACLQPRDTDSVTQCAQAHGSDPARVFVTYRHGVTYIATGRGCAAWGGQPPAPDCQVLGPFSATL
jgi:hypothetical protein